MGHNTPWAIEFVAAYNTTIYRINRRERQGIYFTVIVYLVLAQLESVLFCRFLAVKDRPFDPMAAVFIVMSVSDSLSIIFRRLSNTEQL
jgi:hypothetical protein